MTDTTFNTIEDTIYSIAVSNQTLFTARQTGLYHSTDGGENWVNTYQSWMPDLPIATLTVKLSPNFEKDNTIITGINGGIVLSTDGGTTWEVHQFRNPIPMITGIGISPNFSIDQTIVAGTYEDGMFRSVDAGRTWQAFNFGLFDHNILCLAVSHNFDDDAIVYAGTSSGIYKSINGGRLWQDITLPIGYDAILSIALSADGALYAGTETNGILKSQDHGETWTSVYEAESAINSILVLSDDRLIGQMDDTVMLSDDDGATWTVMIDSDVNIITIADDKQSIIAGLEDMTIQVVNL
jgi:photosystem II stability/assembly factor-like uncharacterized protein